MSAGHGSGPKDVLNEDSHVLNCSNSGSSPVSFSFALSLAVSKSRKSLGFVVSNSVGVACFGSAYVGVSRSV